MIAAILAKRSERFPGKHMLDFRGTTIIGYMVDKLRSSGLFTDVIILTKDPDVRDENATVLEDYTSGTALDSITHLIKNFGEVFVLAGDMPLISTTFIAEMLSKYRGKPLFPVHADGLVEPLHGIYNEPMLACVERYVGTGKKSLTGLIETCVHDEIAIDLSMEESFSNINTIEDLDRMFTGQE